MGNTIDAKSMISAFGLLTRNSLFSNHDSLVYFYTSSGYLSTVGYFANGKAQYTAAYYLGFRGHHLIHIVLTIQSTDRNLIAQTQCGYDHKTAHNGLNLVNGRVYTSKN